MVKPFSYPEIGKVMRILRIDTGETQRQMAQSLGISPTKLSKIETGLEKLDKRLSDRIVKLYKKFWNKEEKERFDAASKLSRNVLKRTVKKDKATQ